MSRFWILSVLIVVSSAFSSAQVRETRGTMSLVEGRRYYVAFPQVWAAPSEKPLNPAMMLYVSSKVKANIHVRTPAAVNDAARIDRMYTLEPNKVLQIPISTAYMNTASQTRKGYGILVTGDKPISVFTFQAWFGNGELARHLPTEAWGREYYSMNFYQDRYGNASTGLKYRPSQILVISQFDNTVVTYTPTVDTESGSDAKTVAKGTSQSVTLQRGETYLIKDKIDETLVKDFRSDLSGTLITSTKPIGVVSGHTKVAIMRYPDVLPPTGMFATEAYFVRNNVHDVMLPFEMSGKEFVMVPCRYTPTRVTGQTSIQFGIDDDRGDVIRFIALEDSTVIQSMSEDGTTMITWFRLNRGETGIEPVQEIPSYWSSNKRVLMGQYGKSYAKILPPIHGKETEPVQGHPTVESGMPMLEVIPSIDRWTSYGTFKSPEGMDNFFNIAFNPKDGGKIKVDGKPLNSAFGGSLRLLAGTPYATVRTPLGAGDHVVESVSDDVKWCAWTYGSLDGLQQGRAYGTPVSIDLAIPCNDSLSVTESISCGDVMGVGTIVSNDTSCGSVFAVYAEDLTNYELVVDEAFFSGDSKVNFSLKVLDKTKDASAKVKVISRSGKFVDKEYTYIADKINWDPKNLNWGAIAYNTSVSKQFTIQNLLPDRTVFVNELRAKHYPGVYTFSPTDVKLAPGQSQIVTVTAQITDSREKLDTMIAVLDCYEQQANELRVRGEEPIIYVSDQTWNELPCGSPCYRKSVIIRNGSSADLVITAYDETKLPMIDDGVAHFCVPQNLDEKLPITLHGGQSHEFTVMYCSRGDSNVVHRVDIPFTSNAYGVDSVAVLIGKCGPTSADDQVVEATSFAISPMPVVLSRDASVTLSVPPSATKLRLIDALGRELALRQLENTERVILDSKIFPSSGLYCISISTSHGERIVPLICLD